MRFVEEHLSRQSSQVISLKHLARFTKTNSTAINDFFLGGKPMVTADQGSSEEVPSAFSSCQWRELVQSPDRESHCNCASVDYADFDKRRNL
jgi:hypothetical protein